MIVPFIAVTRLFIQSKCRPSSIHKKCHIANHSLREKFHNPILKNFISRVREDFERSFSNARNDSLVIVFFSKHLPRITHVLKMNSVSIVKNCLEQIEFVMAYRIRRGQQMITLYSRMWDERALKFLFQRMKRIFHKRAKHFIIGASFVAFDWEKEKIPDEELKRHINEMDVIKILRKRALNGDKERHSNPSTNETEPECACADCNTESTVHKWEPFIIEEDVTVWKMQHPHYKTSGLFCYKLYGKYNDVTAEDFLEVFLDTENRTKWDTHAAILKLIDKDPASNSDVIYWETRWPTLFSNRDYVFKRRYYIDTVNNVIIVVNKSTEHPEYPPSSSKARVTEYWSYMVIKATDSIDKPGMEFSLTYFDNPGISLPSAISLWVTVQGMPEYLKRLKIEALAIGEKRRSEKSKQIIEEPEERAKQKEGRCKCNETPPPRTPPSSPPSSDPDSHLAPYDYVFIFSSYFQKIRTSLWL